MDVEQALSGLGNLDPQAITQIHAAYFPSVFRYALYRVGDETVAEDLASETFIRLLEAAHARRGPKSSIRGWLMGTASNLTNDYFRKAYNQPTSEISDEIPAPNGNPRLQVEKSAQRAELQAALRQLTPEQQHVLALRFGSGCSLADTAEILGKNPNAIKQLQFRALSTLKRKLAGGS